MKGLIPRVKSMGRFVMGSVVALAVLCVPSLVLATDPPSILPPVDVSQYATSLGTSLGTVIAAAIGVGLGIFVVFMGIQFLKRLAKS